MENVDYMIFMNDLHDFKTEILGKVDCISKKMALIERHCGLIQEKGSIVSQSTDRIDFETRNIIDNLVWKTTISDTVGYINRTFQNYVDRERFLRNCLELVMEKNCQYRKMFGNLVKTLLIEGAITSKNVINMLLPVLLLIENTAKPSDIKHWSKLTEIFLPIVQEGHVRLTVLQREGQNALNSENYAKFLRNFMRNLDVSDGYRKNASEIDSNCFLENVDLTNRDTAKYKERMMDCLLYTDKVETMVGCAKTLIKTCDPAVLTYEMFEIAFQIDDVWKVGDLLLGCLSCDVIYKSCLIRVLPVLFSELNILMENKFCNRYICACLTEVLIPVILKGILQTEEIMEIAETSLSYESAHNLVSFINNELNEVSQSGENCATSNGKQCLNRRKKMQMEKDPSVMDEFQEGSIQCLDLGNEEKCLTFNQSKGFNKIRNKKVVKSRIPPPSDNARPVDQLQPVMMGDQADAKVDLSKSMNDINSTLENELNDDDDHNEVENAIEGEEHFDETQQKEAKLDEPNATGDTKEPETMPSYVINEKTGEMVQELLVTGDFKTVVHNMSKIFSKFQIDSVFGAIIKHCNNKPQSYRVMSGYLIAEMANAYGDVTVQNSVINRASLVLGDFTDTAEFWICLADIIAPVIVKEKLYLQDLLHLPKYFLVTEACTSLISALFHAIIRERSLDWLATKWRDSKLVIEQFVPKNRVKSFVLNNNFEFCLYTQDFFQQNKPPPKHNIKNDAP